MSVDLAPRSRTQVVLPGGLGNQLFALVFCLNLLNDAHPRIDLITRHYKWYRVHQVEIGSLIEILGASGQVPAIRGEWSYIPTFVQRFLFHLTVVKRSVVEAQSPMKPSALSKDVSQVVRGYFQDSENVDKLGPEFLETLRDWVTNSSFDNAQSVYFAPMRQAVADSVVVHVRRGNFRLSPNNGVLSSDYIASALRHLNLSNERLLLLSDDPPELLTDIFIRLQDEGYVCDTVPNGHLMPAREALSVLASAKALVLANSTLSWWGARLNLNRPIVRPSEWLRSQQYTPNLHLPGAYIQAVSYESSLSTAR